MKDVTYERSYLADTVTKFRKGRRAVMLMKLRPERVVSEVVLFESEVKICSSVFTRF